MEPLVKKFLKTHTFAQLEGLHGVVASFNKLGTKFSLNYSQIDSKENDKIAQQCRGLILSKPDGSVFEHKILNNKKDYSHICPGDTVVLAYPFDRFFNYGQGACAPINWKDPELKVFEKYDGTLIILYFDPFTNAWCTATRSVPEADIAIEYDKYTFRTLFEKAIFDTIGEDFETYCTSLFKTRTYCFELMSPYNRVYVVYDKCNTVLLGSRDIPTYKEVADNTSNKIPTATYYSLSSINEIIEYVNGHNPMKHEGVVIIDSNFNRIKVKNINYVSLCRIKESLNCSKRSFVSIILNEKDDDIIPYMPEEIVNDLIRIKENISIMLKTIDSTFQELSLKVQDIKNEPMYEGWNDRKIFASLVKQSKLWEAPFFEMYVGRYSNIKEYVLGKKKDGEWSNGFLDNILNFIGEKSDI